MCDIFISYASDDRDRAEVLAGVLEDQGWLAWWDRKILPGDRFDQMIKEALDKAKCIIVLWSRKSVESEWVLDEAETGKIQGILVPILIETVEIPLGFKRIQAARLIDWDGETDHREFQKLLKAVRATLYPDEQEADENTNVELTTNELEAATKKRWLPRIADFIIKKHSLFSTTAVGMLILAVGILAVKHWPQRGDQSARLLLNGEPRVEAVLDSDFYNISFEFVRAQPVELGTIKFQVLSDTDYEGLILDLRASVGSRSGQVPESLKDIKEGGRSAGLVYRKDADNHTLTVTVSNPRVRLMIMEEKLLEEPVIWRNGVEGRAWYKSISALVLGLTLLSLLIFGVRFWALRPSRLRPPAQA